MEEQIKIGERVNELLLMKNIDNKTFASAIGVNISTVSRWKSNSKFMRLN